jgi:hypothetical protein
MTVPANSQQEPLRRALEAKILIDITGNTDAQAGVSGLISDIDKAVKARRMSAVKATEAEEFPVFTGTDSKGNVYVITPKDQEDLERMHAEIATCGSLRIPKPKPTPAEFRGIPAFGGLSSISIEDIPLKAPEPKED